MNGSKGFVEKYGWRILVRALVFQSVFVLLSLWQRDLLTSEHSALTILHVLRLVTVILASLLALVRRNRDHYIPVLSEMTDKAYWRVVFFFLIVLRVPFLKSLQSGGMLNLFYSYALIFLATLLLFNLTLFYHQRIWARKHEEERRNRITELRNLSNLSEKELARVESILIEASAGIQRQLPLSHLALRVFLALIGGLIINLLSGNIADALISLGINGVFTLP